jgi:hypothetical protein
MNKNLSILNLSIALLTLISLLGCKKTEEQDTKTILVGKIWKITSRIENGGTASLPDCAKDDTLEFKTDATFNSLIGATQCNPSEFDVVGGAYKFSDDQKIITFTVPGFEYTGNVISATSSQMVIEFNLGPGFIIQDTFIPK